MKDTRQRPKALPSAQAMALGKQLKELKNIFTNTDLHPSLQFLKQPKEIRK